MNKEIRTLLDFFIDDCIVEVDFAQDNPNNPIIFSVNKYQDSTDFFNVLHEKINTIRTKVRDLELKEADYSILEYSLEKLQKKNKVFRGNKKNGFFIPYLSRNLDELRHYNMLFVVSSKERSKLKQYFNNDNHQRFKKELNIFLKHYVNSIDTLISFLQETKEIFTKNENSIQRVENQETNLTINIDSREIPFGDQKQKLTCEQTSILFYYLKEYGIIADYNNTDLSYLVGALSCFSSKSIKKDFSNIHEIINAKKRNIEQRDLQEIIKHLENLLTLIKEAKY